MNLKRLFSLKIRLARAPQNVDLQPLFALNLKKTSFCLCQCIAAKVCKTDGKENIIIILLIGCILKLMENLLSIAFVIFSGSEDQVAAAKRLEP